MRDPFDGLAFRPADILLPQNCDYTKWSVVACDQYTSQPEYWQEVEELVGSAPSTLRLILPESCLDGPSVETDIMEVNNTMTRYLREERFCTLPASLIYVERRLDNLRLRRGLVGMVDLEQYDYEPGAEAQVRATEGTVMARIPPRVAVRKNAPLELPHVMLLADDPEKTVLEPLSARKDQMEKVYDFDLMERGGHIAGWRLDGESMALVAAALRKLADPAAFRARYGVEDKPVLLFAVGDGNHSLATAKECYERQKKLTPREQWDSLPARYALCELVNLHDASLEFEPIHRVVFGVEPERVVEELLSALSDRWPHRDALRAGLLRRTGRGEEAAELWERRLLNAATEVYESLVSLQELALQAERLEDGARLAALIEETVERYALIPGVASSGRLQQAAAEGDKTAALSALRDMLEALNRSWDGGGLYPHLLPGTQVAVGSVLLPGLLLELQREPELAFLQDEPEFQALLKRYGGGTH